MEQPKEMILLGAGASIDAGNPSSTGLTWELFRGFEGQEECANAFRYVTSILGAALAAEGRNQMKELNVEEVFNAIEMLSERDHIAVAPFVSSWHGGVGKVEHTGDMQYDFDRFEDMVYQPFLNARSASSCGADSDFVAVLCQQLSEKINKQQRDASFGKSFKNAVLAVLGTPRRTSVFKTTLIVMKDILRKRLWISDQDKVKYLKPLVEHCHRKQIPIATLNYDNAIELCAKSSNIQVDPGVRNWTKQGVLNFEPGELQLLKLHGSLNWSQTENPPEDYRPAPELSFYIVPDSEVKNCTTDDSVIIFGHRNKLRADGPFLKLLSKFEQELEKAERLTVIGYSFQYDHINSLLCNWLNLNSRSNSSGWNEMTVVNGESFSLEQIPFFRDEYKDHLSLRIKQNELTAAKGIKKLFAPVTTAE